MSQSPPLVELDAVTVKRDRRTVLTGVSLSLAHGERLALIGANGAGKTTLLRTIVGLERASAGVVRINGQACRSEKAFRPVRAQIGYVFQDPDDQLFCPTVIDDVAFGPLNLGLAPADALARARAVLSRLALDHLAERITYRLSGGEKRLVSLAAVLAMEPEALLLDEPTNGLDDRHMERFLGVLDALDMAMVIVSHDQHLLAHLATRAVALKDGRLQKAVFHRHPHTHDHPHIHILADE